MKLQRYEILDQLLSLACWKSLHQSFLTLFSYLSSGCNLLVPSALRSNGGNLYFGRVQCGSNEESSTQLLCNTLHQTSTWNNKGVLRGGGQHWHRQSRGAYFCAYLTLFLSSRVCSNCFHFQQVKSGSSSCELVFHVLLPRGCQTPAFCSPVCSAAR